MKTATHTFINIDENEFREYMFDRVNAQRIRIRQLEEDVKFWQEQARLLGYEEAS